MKELGFLGPMHDFGREHVERLRKSSDHSKSGAHESTFQHANGRPVGFTSVGQFFLGKIPPIPNLS